MYVSSNQIEALEVEVGKYRDSLKANSHLETQVNSLLLQQEMMSKAKLEWDREREVLQGNLEVARETIETLKQQLEELHASKEGGFWVWCD